MIALRQAQGAPEQEAVPERVWSALGTVLDPELDEPITDLGFVTSCVVDHDQVAVRLRLPTAFCSPSFAYLMASDAYDVVEAVPGVATVSVVLDDHSDSAVINAGIAGRLGFAAAFPEEADEELDALRMIFRRKAHQAYVERVCTAVAGVGWSADDLAALTVADVPDGRLRDGLVRRRTDLGLSAAPTDRVCVDEDGVPWPVEQVQRRLRFAKSVRVSIDGNAHFCRALLTTRYPGSEAAQATREHELLTLIPR